MCISSQRNVNHLTSFPKEADTKIILHAVEVSQQNPKKIRLFASDTYVLVLAIRRFPLLCKDTAVVSITQTKITALEPLARGLGSLRMASLPALHAILGSDVTGRFSGKGKKLYWKAFLDADGNELTGLAALGNGEWPSNASMDAVKLLSC